MMDGKIASENNHIYAFGPFRLDVPDRRLLREGEPVLLARKAFDLLLILVEAAGRLQTREKLIETLWPQNIVEEHGLTVKMHALRKALGDEGAPPRYIETVRGVGYRFIAPVAIEKAARTEASPNADTHAFHKRRRRVLTGAALVVLLTVVGLLAWLFIPRPSSARVPSIAVLPFENLSADKDNAYFASGIQDMILTRLAGIRGLKVISRTSTERYKGRSADLGTIARQLGVTSVLEGSVQRVDGTVDVDVQLIDTRTFGHIWAHDYTRKLSDIFGIEGEISQEVADALGAKLTGAERRSLATHPTTNPAAYDAYLRGVAFTTRAADSFKNFGNAVKYFTQAVKLDPDFALAWAKLSLAHLHMYLFGYDHTPERLTKAREAAERALRLAPDLGQAWLAEGDYLFVGLNDYAGARKAYGKARKLLPNNTEVLNEISYLERDQGQWQEALAHEWQADQLDPRNSRSLYQWGLTYVALRRFTQAQVLFNRALDLTPDDIELISLLAATWQAQGHLDAADKLIASLPAHPTDFRAVCVRVNQMLYRRDYDAAIETLESALAKPDPALGDGIGYYYRLLGLAEQRAGDTAGAHATYLKGRTTLQALRKAGDNSFWLLDNLGIMEAGLGNAAAARRAAGKAIAMTAGETIYGPSAKVNLARIEVELGDADAALAILRYALRVPYGQFMSGVPLTPALLRLDPTWDPIRRDPRFQTLLKQHEARVAGPATVLPVASKQL